MDDSKALEPDLPLNREASWRQTHLGRLLGEAIRRFDARVLALMAYNVEVPLALSNLAARQQVSAAHVHITRHLALSGSRLGDLAQSAGMSKQAMGDLVDQCEAWGLVVRTPDPLDARARRVQFTATGLAWLQAFADAVAGVAPYPITTAEMVNTIASFEAIINSIKTDAAIKL